MEGWAEAGPALDEDENDVETDGEDGASGVCPVFEGEEMLEVLVADCSAETEGGKADADPRELVGDTNDTGGIMSMGMCLLKEKERRENILLQP